MFEGKGVSTSRVSPPGPLSLSRPLLHFRQSEQWLAASAGEGVAKARRLGGDGSGGCVVREELGGVHLLQTQPQRDGVRAYAAAELLAP